MSAADQWEACQAVRAEQWELGPIVYQQRSVEERQLLADNFAKRIEAHRMRQNRFTGRHTDERLAIFGAALPVTPCLPPEKEGAVESPLSRAALGILLDTKSATRDSLYLCG